MPSVLRVFDPAMCCSTGVCGPVVDPVLPRFAADLEWLGGQGVSVERYNLSQQPAAFVATELVTRAIAERGTECLPILLLDGRIVAEGQYPSRAALAALAGVSAPAPEAPIARTGCAPKSGPSAAPGSEGTPGPAKCC